MSSVEHSPPPEAEHSLRSDTEDPPGKSDDSMGMSKKGQPWTEEEHLAFLAGLKKLGKGNWRGISKYFVPTRTPTQVASHAQKHFMRVHGATKRKSRFSALEHEVMGLSSSKQATSTSSQPAAAPQASFPAMQMPCMFPPMLFAFPGASPFMPPFMYPPPALAAAAAMTASMQKQGMMMPMFPGFSAMQASMPAYFMAAQAAAMAQQRAAADAPVVCKPEAVHPSTTGETNALLNQLPSSNETQVALHASSHSAFRPPQEIKA